MNTLPLEYGISLQLYTVLAAQYVKLYLSQVLLQWFVLYLNKPLNPSIAFSFSIEEAGHKH